MRIFCTLDRFAALECTDAFGLRDAQAACYAADGYARASGRAAAVVAVGAAESSCLASAFLTAWGDKVPLVGVSVLPAPGYSVGNNPFAAVSRGNYVVDIRSVGDTD